MIEILFVCATECETRSARARSLRLGLALSANSNLPWKSRSAPASAWSLQLDSRDDRFYTVFSGWVHEFSDPRRNQPESNCISGGFLRAYVSDLLQICDTCNYRPSLVNSYTGFTVLTNDLDRCMCMCRIYRRWVSCMWMYVYVLFMCMQLSACSALG